MKKRKKSGPARMMELGKKKIEVWLTEEQMLDFALVAAALYMPVATLARRCCNYLAASGKDGMIGRGLKSKQYD